MPTLAQGPKVRLSYLSEVTLGTSPGGTPKTLRNIGRNINFKKRSLVSQETRPDRQVGFFRHGMHSVEGDIPVELAYAAFDDFLEAALAGTWTSGVLDIGSTMRSFTIERAMTDVAVYQRLLGCVVNRAQFRIQPEQLVQVSFGILGLTEDVPSGSTLGAPSAASTNDPFTAFEGTISEGGSEIGIVTGLDFTLDNGRQLTGVVGSPISPTVFEGTAKINGTLSVFVTDAVLLAKFYNETVSSLEVSCEDLAGNTLDFSFPKIKYAGGDSDPPKEGGVIVSMPFQAMAGGSPTSTLRITRTPA